MKEALYNWMKYLAVFYILLTAVLYLVPGKKYERYVRFFMGLLLIFMLLSPVSAVLGKSGELLKNFHSFYRQEEGGRKLLEMENLQKVYLEKGYEEEIKKKLADNLQQKGINPAEVQVHIEGEKLTAVLYMEKLPDEKQEGRIKNALMENWGMGEGDYEIRAYGAGAQTVVHPASSGNASGSDCSSGIR